jgi:hypothetical protein
MPQDLLASVKGSDLLEGAIDMKSGAPARVRLMVGSAPDKDRLAEVKRFYPDAEPFGEDNFVFTDQKTGKKTLYNPKGLDAGDVASIAREGAQAVGSAMGATLGAAGSALTGPAAPATVIPATAAGAGAGSAVAGSLFDIARSLAGGVDTRNAPERLTDTALDFGSAAVGQRLGEMGGEKLAKVIAGKKNVAVARLQDFKDAGISNPPPGAVTGSRMVQGAEKALTDMPASANVMQGARDKVLSEVKQYADDLVKEIGEAKTKQGAGDVIKAGSQGALERITARTDQIYDKAFELVGPNTKVPLESVKQMQAELMALQAKASKSTKGMLGKAAQTVANLVDDAGDEGLDFSVLRTIRTQLRLNIKQTGAMVTGAENAANKSLYAALTNDMSEAAKAAGPEAAKALSLADRYTRFQANQVKPLLEKVVNLDADEKAFGFAMSAAKDGGTKLAALRRNFKPEEWDTVAATVLNRLGQAKAGAQEAAGDTFSVNTFLTNWNGLAKEAKVALFGGTRYSEIRPDLDKLVRIAGALKETERLTAPGTSRQLAYQGVLSALGGGAGLLAGGDMASAGAGVAGTVVAPYVAAKLITSKSFTNWLVGLGKTGANDMAPQIARLVAIAKAEPAIKEEIAQFVQALRPSP